MIIVAFDIWFERKDILDSAEFQTLISFPRIGRNRRRRCCQRRRCHRCYRSRRCRRCRRRRHLIEKQDVKTRLILNRLFDNQTLDQTEHDVGDDANDDDADTVASWPVCRDLPQDEVLPDHHDRVRRHLRVLEQPSRAEAGIPGPAVLRRLRLPGRYRQVSRG